MNSDKESVLFDESSLGRIYVSRGRVAAGPPGARAAAAMLIQLYHSRARSDAIAVARIIIITRESPRGRAAFTHT
ncbi:hypothetical protein EVAR_33054_1 [Eumeta japonica]|uniref:Uncharacterized protein n=1 Tax=Eumeta variegata TaxID=151549 RepID=A0A4C1WWZ2_EUMVA|nr:hypothetical protein EVAR_33054_1 [Eumeta japonica]